MYRCKECNTEYKVKPDYCDCGNDTFDYIEEKPVKQPITLEQKSEIVSRIFFVLCLIIAICVWFIPMKTKPQHKPAPVVQTKTSIPDINKIWNDTPIYQPKPQQPIQPIQPIPNTEPIILTPTAPVQKKNLTDPAKKVPVTKIPVTTKPVQKPVQTAKSTPVTKPNSKPVEKTVVKTEPIVKLEPTKTSRNSSWTKLVNPEVKPRRKESLVLLRV